MSRTALLAGSLMFVLAAPAYAHVDVRPERAPAGGEARLTFDVENERSDAATRAIVIQMPRGVTSVESLSVRGWRMATAGSGGAPVRRATLTAPAGRELTGAEHGRFRLRVGLPRREGTTLTFKVLQRYDDGQIVRCIGPAGTSEPAPTLRLTAARDPAPAPAPEPSAGEREEATEPPSSQGEDTSDDNGDGGVPIWAGVGLIVLAALAGSALARRRNRRRLDR
jgi:periplasmic copper chaperone A